MQNVVTTIFNVESEAYQAFSELRKATQGEGYAVIEAALLKREEGEVELLDAIDAAAVTSNDTLIGYTVGALVGILGGPIGVLLGASTGALIGATLDSADAADSVSMVEVIASKLIDGEIAMVALVEEEEPAFDAVVDKFDAIIVRHDAEAVAAEVERAIELTGEMVNIARQQLRADTKAEIKAGHDEYMATLRSRFEEVAARRAAEEQEMIADAVDAAKAEL